MRIFRFAGPVMVVVLLVSIPACRVGAADPHTELALGALSWVASQQLPDGSFPGFSAATTADAVFAICAVGGDPNGFLQEGHSPISYLADHVGEIAGAPGSTAKAILAVACAGKDPRNLGGVDLVAALERAYDGTSGRYGSDLAGHSFAVLALAAVGRPIPDAAISWIRQAQAATGGWSWSGDPLSDPDTNSTALAVQSLVAAGVPPADPSIRAALSYLHTQQNADGGFPYAKPSPYGSATDANSTAYVIQALVAAGEDPEGPAWTAAGGTPLTALWRLQLPSGALEWQAGYGENALATYQAIPALMLRPFPLARLTVGEAPPLLPAAGAGPIPSAGLASAGLGALLIGLSLRRFPSR